MARRRRYPQADLALALGLSKARVSQMVSAGMPTDLEGAKAWRAAHVALANRPDQRPHDNGNGGAPDTAVTDWNAQRSRLTKLRADRLERELDGKDHGGVMPVDKVRRMLELGRLSIHNCISRASDQVALEVAPLFKLNDLDRARLAIALDKHLRIRMAEVMLNDYELARQAGRV